MSAISDEDLLRLHHMLDTAREVVLFTRDATRDDLDTDLKLLRALSMSTGIIGEAASQLSAQGYGAACLAGLATRRGPFT